MDRSITILDNLEHIEEIKPQDLIIEKTGFNTMLEREVTIRYLNPIAAADPRLRCRFIKEARTLASLRHRNIVHVYDVGLDSQNCPYMVLEKPAGISVQTRLAQLLGQRAQMEINEILQIVGDVSAALQHLHQKSILLHGLSPNDIIITRQDETVLTSLGQPVPANTLAAPAEMLAYAPPERLLNDRVDVRSDIYSLGVLLYQLLFGQMPFEGDNTGIIVQKQNGNSLPALETAQTDLFISNELKQILCRATARHPRDRYANVESFRTALTEVLSHHFRQVQLPEDLSASTNNGSPYAYAETTRPGKNGHNGTGAVKHNGATKPSGNGQTAMDVVSFTSQPDHSQRTSLDRALFSQTAHTARKDKAEAGHQPSAAQVLPKQHKMIANARAAEANQDQIDPLMPGRDDPELQAALPFTTLVPMPAEAEGEPEPEQFSLAENAVSRGLDKYKRPLSIVALGALGIMAALSLG
jgi:serine/threonine protein kinase